MTTNYLIRLDDACPAMDNTKWEAVFSVLTKHDVKALIGIIPNNADAVTMPCAPDTCFWQRMRELELHGHVIALHGYDHCYATECGGINPVHNRSEFAGLPYTAQAEKLQEGYTILTEQGLHPKVFFAPSHTFDNTTVEALKKATPIRHVSDTVDYRPYRYNGITILPQQMGRCRKIMMPGYWTFCLHPNNMTTDDISAFSQFIQANRQHMMNYDRLLNVTPALKKSLFGRLLELAFSAKRSIVR